MSLVQRAWLLLLLIIAAVVSGCAVGPNFTRPGAPAVSGYDAGPVPLPLPGGNDSAQRFVDGAVAERWWSLFQSRALDDTVNVALAGSPTLAAARATLAQAREVVVAARANYFPQVDVTASGSWQHERSLAGTSKTTTSSSGSRGSTSTSSSTLVTDMFSIGPALSTSVRATLPAW